MNKKIRNDAGTLVRQQLLNFARNAKRPFNEVLQYYMMERFIYRLSKSPYKNRFILKGALMFVVWELIETRSTRDIDLLGKTRNTVANLTKIIQDICKIECAEDAARFFSDSVECELIQEQNEYNGIGVYFDGELAKTRARMKIDIGFGDSVFPQPMNVRYPTLLDMPSPYVLGYTSETLIAEKIHAMVRFGLRNSRIKDYFDVWFLSQKFKFDGTHLSAAIHQTFSKRKMKISALESQVFDDLEKDTSKQSQWKSFLDKNRIEVSSESFSEIIKQLRAFIHPIFEFNIREKSFQLSWHPPGPWK